MREYIRKYPFIQKYGLYILFIAGGALLGFAYWRFIGCRTGSCPITASWHTSVLFGSMAGFLALPTRRKPENTTKEKDHEK